MNTTERLLPVREVVARTSCSRASLYQWVRDKKFPAPVRISENRIAWPESAVAAWIADKIAAAH